MPDVYDFDIKASQGVSMRNMLTMIGENVANFGTTTGGTPYDIYFHGYQNIPFK